MIWAILQRRKHQIDTDQQFCWALTHYYHINFDPISSCPLLICFFLSLSLSLSLSGVVAAGEAHDGQFSRQPQFGGGEHPHRDTLRPPGEDLGPWTQEERCESLPLFPRGGGDSGC